MTWLRRKIDEVFGGIFAGLMMASLNGVKIGDVLKEAGIKLAKVAAAAFIPLVLIMVQFRLLTNVIYNTPPTTDLTITVVLLLVTSSLLGYLSMEGLLAIFGVDNKR